MKKECICLLFFLSCCDSDSQPPSTNTTESLKNDILSKPCDPSVIEELRTQIESQSRTLTPEQFKNSLRNMREDTQC